MKIAQIEQKHKDLNNQNHAITKKIRYYRVKKIMKAREPLEKLEKCLICQKEVKSSEIAKHICNENENFINCDYCSHTFESIIGLRDHLNVFHDDKSFYYCKKCSGKFDMKCLLQYHIQSKCCDQIDEGSNIEEYIANSALTWNLSENLKRMYHA